MVGVNRPTIWSMMRGEGVRANATAIATAHGRRAPARSSCAIPTLPYGRGRADRHGGGPAANPEPRHAISESQARRLCPKVDDKVKAFPGRSDRGRVSAGRHYYLDAVMGPAPSER